MPSPLSHFLTFTDIQGCPECHLIVGLGGVGSSEQVTVTLHLWEELQFKIEPSFADSLAIYNAQFKSSFIGQISIFDNLKTYDYETVSVRYEK